MDISENSVCSICRDEFKTINDFYTLKCNHKFHIECLNPWLKIQGSCPYCKQHISMYRILEFSEYGKEINNNILCNQIYNNVYSFWNYDTSIRSKCIISQIFLKLEKLGFVVPSYNERIIDTSLYFSDDNWGSITFFIDIINNYTLTNILNLDKIKWFRAMNEIWNHPHFYISNEKIINPETFKEIITHGNTFSNLMKKYKKLQ